MHVELSALIRQADDNIVVFHEVISTIRRHYECQPCGFRTGSGTARETLNSAGTNAGSCLLLAFAARLGLNAQTTLKLYGEHYRSVLADPHGHEHANIRAFIANGWAGVVMEGSPLRLRGPS